MLLSQPAQHHKTAASVLLFFSSYGGHFTLQLGLLSPAAYAQRKCLKAKVVGWTGIRQTLVLVGIGGDSWSRW